MAPIDEEKQKVKDGVNSEKPKKRVNKPLIEKRRRERINECLSQLQNLISQLDNDKHKVGRPAKLEKADILEMTVEFVRKTKSKTQVTLSEDSEIQNQSFLAGYRKCVDEVGKFCKDNNIPTDLKSALQQNIEQKIRQLKTEEAVDLSVKTDKQDIRLNEQLQLLANSSPAIQPKVVNQGSVQNNVSFSTQSNNNNIQLIQKSGGIASNNTSYTTSGQVTVVCQKEPPTYVLVPAAALCQPIQLSNSNQGLPIIVQNSAPSYEYRQNAADRSGQILSLTNQGQVLMIPNSTVMPQLPNGTTNMATTAKPLFGDQVTVSTAPYFPVVVSLSSSMTSTCSGPVSAPGSVLALPNNRLCLAPRCNSNVNLNNENEANSSEDMWRPW